MEMKTNSDVIQIGLRIKRAREQAGLTQLELATQLNVKQQTVQAWEAGRAHPRVSRLKDVAAALKVDENWLAVGLYPGEGITNEHYQFLIQFFAALSKLTPEQLKSVIEQIESYAQYDKIYQVVNTWPKNKKRKEPPVVGSFNEKVTDPKESEKPQLVVNNSDKSNNTTNTKKTSARKAKKPKDDR